ncbi:MAG: hypothetical protein F6K28_19435, partial [Microcoleus sp. SIO2G3]|nr:hypothetical protein [Microcoleus sp. SIO2G3]
MRLIKPSSILLRWNRKLLISLRVELPFTLMTKETGLGDEGGFAPDLAGTRAALDLIGQAVDR